MLQAPQFYHRGASLLRGSRHRPRSNHALEGAWAIVGARAAVSVLAAALSVTPRAASARAGGARTVAARAAVAAALVPPPLGPSSLPLPAPTKPAPPKLNITEGSRQGEDGRRAQARLPSPCTCALQKSSGSLVHYKAERRPDHVDQVEIMLGRGTWDFPPVSPDLVFAVCRILATHWPLAATAHQKSPITNVLEVSNGPEAHHKMSVISIGLLISDWSRGFCFLAADLNDGLFSGRY
jgi:hypothetical protein